MGIDFLPTGIATGLSGALTGSAVINAVPGLGALVIPAGLYAMYAVGANITYQVQDQNGAWQNITVAGVGGIIVSDGTNFRWNNTNAAAQNVTTIKIG